MQIEHSSLLDAPAAVLAEYLLDPQTMCFLMRPFVMVEPVEPATLPPCWVPGRYRVHMRLGGLIPLGWQDLVVTAVEANATAQRWSMRDEGTGRLARRWDHRLMLEGVDDRRARYTDRVDVEAGIATIGLWIFAHVLFAWRHHRWRVLAGRR